MTGSKFKSHFKRLPVQTIAILFLLLQPQASPPKAFADNEQETVARIEQRLFFRQYSEDDLPARLKRIETQVFGESFSDSVGERLNRITNALPPQETPPSQAVEKPVVTTPPPTRPDIDNMAPAQNSAQENEEARENQRIEALRARDEEVNRMLKEGISLWRAKNGEQAIDRFRQVVRLDPQNAQGFYSLGVALEAKSDFSEAEECYRKAAELDPRNKEYVQALKAIEKKSSAQKQADSKDQEIRQLAQDAAREYQSGQYVSAIDLYKQLDEKKPNDPLTKYNIATIYLAMNRPVSALDYYKQATRLDPKEPKYKASAERLEANIKRDESERQQAEQAWNSPGQGAGLQSGSYVGNQPMPMQSNSTDRGGKREHVEKQKPPKGPSFERDPLEFYGLNARSSKEGIKVVDVVPSSRAAQVGLKSGDVIVAVDGAVVNNLGKLKETILHRPQGARFQFNVERGGQLGRILF
jgi:tetratricopeptide (TPR) repeat protein